MEMNHILVVEDDKEIREGVKISLHPAIFAGTANINTVEKSGAVPPGI